MVSFLGLMNPITVGGGHAPEPGFGNSSLGDQAVGARAAVRAAGSMADGPVAQASEVVPRL